MLLVVTLCPFVCALILFAYFFGRFAGEQDTAKLADAMRQMHYARIIPFPGIGAGDLERIPSPVDGAIVAAASPREVLLFTGSNSKKGRNGLKVRVIAKGTSA